MPLQWLAIWLVLLVSFSIALPDGRTISERYGEHGETQTGYGYDQHTQYNTDNQRQSQQTLTGPSLLDTLVRGIQKVISRRPSERQGPGIAGLISSVQSVAPALAVAGIVAANRDQIADLINPETTTATTTTTAIDQCSGITCTSPLTCDADSGLCKCGTGGPSSCGAAGSLSSDSICILGTGCVCGTTVIGKCSGTTPLCLLSADGGAIAGGETSTVSCQCSGSVQGSCATGEICCNAAASPTYVASLEYGASPKKGGTCQTAISAPNAANTCKS